MELWIRSQDRTLLTTVDRIHICQATSNEYDIIGTYCTLGTYKTKERSLEVLDEIQKEINQIFICKLNHLVSKTDYERIKLDLEVEYPNNEFIMQPQHYELEPINTNVVIYEMPKE